MNIETVIDNKYKSGEYEIVINCINYMLNAKNEFIYDLKRMSEGASLSFYHFGFSFWPEEYEEENDYYDDDEMPAITGRGILFFYGYNKISYKLISYDEFYEILNLASELYIKENASKKGEVINYLEKIYSNLSEMKKKL